jgi:acetyltransferase-like isoleucine patch superfamily enzyme
LAGAVTIGRYTYVGMTVAIKEKVSVGDYAIIGMYSAVYKDIPDEMIAMGNPARPMKRNEERRVFK